MNIIIYIYIHDNIPAARFWVNTKTQKSSALQRRELFTASSFLVWVQTHGTPALSKPQWPSSGIWSEGYNHWIGLISISPVTPEAFELFGRIKIRSWIFKFDVLFIYPNPWVFLVIANLVGSINLEEDGILAGSLPALGLIVPRWVQAFQRFGSAWVNPTYRKLIGNYQNVCFPQVFSCSSFLSVPGFTW